MSIYVHLRSSESKDYYSKNHGGNFKVELSEPLRMQGSWEVALAEMTYHAQAFPNLPVEYSSVKVTLKDWLRVYDTRDKFFYIRTWVYSNGKWISSESIDLPEESRFPHFCSLPSKNYDWEDFKNGIENMGKKLRSDIKTPVTKISLTFTGTDEIECKFESTMRACFEFSKDLVNFLSLSVESVYQAPDIMEFSAKCQVH